MLAGSQDPIVAIATAPGRGAVGIVRVSGRGLMPLAQTLCGQVLVPRVARYGPFTDAAGQAIDHGLALFFPAPHSFTGEDVLELQAHGGPVVLQLLVARCLEAAAAALGAGGAPCLPHLRLAEPGEFTQRAFLNDKLDLAQAEAIADLIDASTEAAARSATRSLSGVFSREVESLRQRLVDLRMLVEATLDFPEEEIDFLSKADARGKLARVAEALAAVLGQARAGALLREGMTVVLAGQPNVGKSSLLNALAGAELAIVTPIAGTTRDKVRETIQIEGVPLHVVDTAGLRADGDEGDVGDVGEARKAPDEVERIGIARSWDAIREADAVLFLHDLTRVHDAAYLAAEQRIAQGLADHGAGGQAVIHVFNKADATAPELAQAAAAGVDGGGGISLSAKFGAGLEDLRQALLERVGWQAAPEGVFIARQRHVQALYRAQAHALQASSWAEQGDTALDLLAEELRLAHDALGSITGAVTPDDLLGEIFTRFCIGK